MEDKVWSLECQASRLMGGCLKGLPLECSIKIPKALCNVLEKRGQGWAGGQEA